MVFVPLTPTNDPALVPAAIAHALHLEPRADVTAMDALHDAIDDRQILLVLDNCEHLLPAALLFADLLQMHPALTILATSRTRLNLNGERVFALDPLSASDARALVELDRIYAKQASLYPGFGDYEKKTARKIPVVELVRA